MDSPCPTLIRLAQSPFEFIDATFGGFASRRRFGQSLLGGIGARRGRSAQGCFLSSHCFRFHVVGENLAGCGSAEPEQPPRGEEVETENVAPELAGP